jgi:hypothetical protein
MKTITIKGRQYVPVVERLKEFQNNEKYAGWKIKPAIIDVSLEYVVMKATILDDKDVERAWGHAGEKREGFVNTTSWVENCETSAIGRALAMLGIGVIDDIASGDEVALARDAEIDQITNIENLLRTCSLDETLRKKVEDELVTLTYARAEKCIAYLMANQRDPVESGDNVNLGDINKKLDDVMADDKK